MGLCVYPVSTVIIWMGLLVFLFWIAIQTKHARLALLSINFLWDNAWHARLNQIVNHAQKPILKNASISRGDFTSQLIPRAAHVEKGVYNVQTEALCAYNAVQGIQNHLVTPNHPV